ncbi:MAG: translation initiation factor IF-2 [Patescibacteria group bacterium]
MNITELARRLKVPTQELKERLPELGFDIGMRAIKVDDRLAQQIIEKWKQEQKRQRLEDKVLSEKEKTQAKEVAEVTEGAIMLPPVISVRDLSAKLGVPVPSLIAELMRNGVMASISEKVEYEIAAIVAEGLGRQVALGEDVSVEQKKAEQLHKDILESKKGHDESEEYRPPVVVVMGHVDHGKTSLLDAIRETQVVSGESGGITQHIGAYQVEKNDRIITFIDTPGHEAFSHMRSRGAIVADVAILVVAADDGVQPQTIEAIKMIQDAELPMVVAINKIDKPEAKPDVVKTGLSELNITVEDWGGDVPSVDVSALKGTNIADLLEVVLLVSDVEKDTLRTTSEGDAQGVIIESHVDKNTGPVATVLVHSGTLKVGDTFHVGDVFGKIRAMKNYLGENVKTAGPSTPVQIIGLSDVPTVGHLLTGGVDLKKLRRESGKRKYKSADTILQKKSAGGENDEKTNPVYPIILKADVAGTLEAIQHSLSELDTEEVQVSVISKGLGSITEVDIVRAAEAGATVYTFHAPVTTQARQLALDREVKIEECSVIYNIIDKVLTAAESMLEPERIRHDQGKLEVLKIFGKREKNIIVGGKITEGNAQEDNKFILYRNNKVMGEGKVAEIRIGPDKRREVHKGDECGLQVSSTTDISEGDVLELYSEETKERKLKRK